MTIQEQHYTFKRKFNKLDSQNKRNLIVPEIDTLLREAEEIFVKSIFNPRIRTFLGFEKNQRSIDDIKVLVTTPKSSPNTSIISIDNNIVKLPDDYWHFIKGEVSISNDVCKNIKADFFHIRHDNSFLNSEMYSSSFDWRIVVGNFSNVGIELFPEDFSIDKFYLYYLKKLPIIHNAQDFRGGSYYLGDTLLQGRANSILPDHTHNEIVDIAVMLAANEIHGGNFKLAIDKLNLNKLIV